MNEVYEVEFCNQREPMNYGLFSSLAKAEQYLRDTLKVDTTKVLKYYNAWMYDGDYRIERRYVK